MTLSIADPDSEEVILTQDQPAWNHNGGMIAFGLDNYLYIGFGDGGGQGDPDGNGQRMDTWLGKILRIEVDPAHTNGEPYIVPEDNPFVSDPDALPEFWALGLRNPWRFSFDRETGDLWIGDVGGGAYEEINVLAVDDAGANLGWRVMEGPECYQGTECDPSSFVEPVFDFAHSTGYGCSIIGGYVYHGEQFADPTGTYVLSDSHRADLGRRDWTIRGVRFSGPHGDPDPPSPRCPRQGMSMARSMSSTTAAAESTCWCHRCRQLRPVSRAAVRRSTPHLPLQQNPGRAAELAPPVDCQPSATSRLSTIFVGEAPVRLPWRPCRTQTSGRHTGPPRMPEIATWGEHLVDAAGRHNDRPRPWLAVAAKARGGGRRQTRPTAAVTSDAIVGSLVDGEILHTHRCELVLERLTSLQDRPDP